MFHCCKYKHMSEQLPQQGFQTQNQAQDNKPRYRNWSKEEQLRYKNI